MFNLLTKVNIHKSPSAVWNDPLLIVCEKFLGGGGRLWRTKREQTFFIYTLPVPSVPLYLMTW